MTNCYKYLAAPPHSAEMADGKAIVEFDCDDAKVLNASRSLVESANEQMMLSLCAQLTGYIYAQDHLFFERLVIDVIFSMGYGGRHRDLARTIGRCGNGGIDGPIALDEFGLDVIYLQAKRLKPGATVADSTVRDFVGDLEAGHGTKGIFISTGKFTLAAQEVANSVSKKIILISGQRLTELMVRYNIGIKARDTLQFKEIDLGYFSGLTANVGAANNNSASIQPRR